MEVQPGLGPRPAVLKAQVQLGVAEGEFNPEAGAVETEEAE